MTENETQFTALRERSKGIISRLLVRTALVKAGTVIEARPEFRARFEHAGTLYRSGLFREALDAFAATSAEAESFRAGAGLTAHFNAAACAAAMEDYNRVINLLLPMFENGRLRGHPLWNLALAYYRLGQGWSAVKTLGACPRNPQDRGNRYNEIG